MTSLLTLTRVSVRFGGLHALDGLSFSVVEGEILGLIGPNGSGKSTVFNVITGIVEATDGSVVFRGQDITGLEPHQVAHRGIARTFQVVRPFLAMSALDNVLVGRLFGGNQARRTSKAVEEAYQLLKQVGLGGKGGMLAGDLTILDRKRLEIARALAGRPELMLLDEFMAGISPPQIPPAVDLVKQVNASGITVIMVEHIIKAITGACDRAVVLDTGRKLAEGPTADIIANPDVIEAYLGSRHAQG